MNLFAKLSINQSIEENEEKIVFVSEKCPVCEENDDTVSLMSSSHFNKLSKRGTTLKNNQTLGSSQIQSPNVPPNDSISQANRSTNLSNKNIQVRKTNLESSKIGVGSVANQPLNNSALLDNISIVSRNTTARATKIYNISDLANLENLTLVEEQRKQLQQASRSRNINSNGTSKALVAKTEKASIPECECLRAYYNYKATKLRVTYLSYVRFKDGANSLLKAETFWQIPFENAISLSIHLQKSRIKLNESLVLNLVFKNLLTQELDLVIEEGSFKFVSAVGDNKNFGALIMENKVSRNVYIGPLTQDSVSFCFMPVKCGMIELEAIRVFDMKSRKEFKFNCGYKILIN